MQGFYVVRNGTYDWHVRYSRFGCNSEIVATYKHASKARTYARQRNNLLTHGVTLLPTYSPVTGRRIPA